MHDDPQVEFLFSDAEPDLLEPFNDLVGQPGHFEDHPAPDGQGRKALETLQEPTVRKDAAQHINQNAHERPGKQEQRRDAEQAQMAYVKITQDPAQQRDQP